MVWWRTLHSAYLQLDEIPNNHSVMPMDIVKSLPRKCRMLMVSWWSPQACWTQRRDPLSLVLSRLTPRWSKLLQLLRPPGTASFKIAFNTCFPCLRNMTAIQPLLFLIITKACFPCSSEEWFPFYDHSYVHPSAWEEGGCGHSPSGHCKNKCTEMMLYKFLPRYKLKSLATCVVATRKSCRQWRIHVQTSPFLGIHVWNLYVNWIPLQLNQSAKQSC